MYKAIKYTLILIMAILIVIQIALIIIGIQKIINKEYFEGFLCIAFNIHFYVYQYTNFKKIN